MSHGFLRHSPMLIFCFATPALAEKSYLDEKQRERDDERWSFSHYLAGKSKLQHQDVLYRFYTGGQGTTSPRIEPYVYGLGLTGKNATGSLTGAGYGGSLYFNNFISSLLKAPTPNMVLGAFAERSEEKHEKEHPLLLAWGGSLRLGGLNQQDTAVFLNYRILRRDLGKVSLREGRWEVAGRLYVLPALSAEGSLLIKDSAFPSRPSDLASHSGYSWGGALDVAMFRLSLTQARDSFSPRAAGVEKQDETRYLLRIGFVL